MTTERIGAGHRLLSSSDDLDVALGHLDAVRRGDPDVDAARLIIAEFAAHHRDLALRSCRPGHLTGSALVLSSDGERTLLMFHTKLQRWLQPGGHADGDTNLAAVALREATEETGIEGLLVDPRAVDLDIHLVAPPAEDPHLHLDVRFVVVAPAGSTPSGNHESQALEWVDLGELDAYAVDGGLIRLAKAARLTLEMSQGTTSSSRGGEG